MDPVEAPQAIKERKKSINVEIEKKRKEIEEKEDQMNKKNALLDQIKHKEEK